MPIYDYECQSCGNKYSAFVQSFSTSDDKVKCPECNKYDSSRELSLKTAIGTTKSVGGCSAPSGSGFS
ncbi:MAG: zinc ribbon domain-containing protein [Candidatus Marinimicrobia bacterium]|nr:zinc ribbon domain-containing protein [Candidatus Neomarinimicrobiota bacterium]MBL7023702.1 zinc ribbon domain-containing protein [Candidatus Neomarinimicrobiota bacterium]MBL7110008.1 zinc ribbon domain-containing protein [Candidatus Neomarinimicrobiota bacterium]